MMFNTHMVVAPTVSGKMSTMFVGTYQQCKKLIEGRRLSLQPTHFCYIIRNTEVAKKRFAKKFDLVY